MSYENFAGIPKRLKGQAWKACRSVTRCQGSNPCSCAIEKLKNSLNSGFFNIQIYFYGNSYGKDNFLLYIAVFQSSLLLQSKETQLMPKLAWIKKYHHV